MKVKRVTVIPLHFKLDVDDTGHQLVTVFLEINGEKELIPDVRQFSTYGQRFMRDNKWYTLSGKSIETLQSLLSCDPTISEDGTLIFAVEPGVLQYLRSLAGINESPWSRELNVLDTSMKQGVNVDYEPGKGLVIEGRYFHDDLPESVSRNEILTTKKGNYARFDRTYIPIPQPESIQEQTLEDHGINTYLKTERLEIPLDQVPEFFTRDLVLLQTDFRAVLTENAEKIVIVEERLKPVVKIGSDEKGWLDFTIEYDGRGYRIPHELCLGTSKELEQTEDEGNAQLDQEPEWVKVDQEPEWVKVDQEAEWVKMDQEPVWIKVDQETALETERLIKDLDVERTEHGFRVPITQFASLEEFVDEIGGIKEVNEAYREFLDSITDLKLDPHFRLPEKMETQLLSTGIDLRPYQREGIQWLSWLMDHHLHGLLADDMGLGKTIQTAVVMTLDHLRHPTEKNDLIICPKSVVHHWTREIRRCFPECRIYEYTGPDRDRDILLTPEPTVIISTYSTITRNIELLRDIPFNFLVLDEATRIKNPSTQRTRAIKSIHSLHRIILTGTPIENRPSELWSLFDFLMKDHLGTYRSFIRNYADPISYGDEQAPIRLARRIRPFILQRLKEDVEKDLPDKIEIMEYCELTEEQKALYAQIQDMQVTTVRNDIETGKNVNFTINILPILTKLKQVCDHPALITKNTQQLLGRSRKFDMIVQKVMDLHLIEDKVVLFSHFLGTLDLFEMVLTKRGVPFIRVDGSTRNRQELFDSFNEGKFDTALLSIQACGHGVNLTGGNHVIHVDRWWNPAVEDQATDRVHRIGQEKSVYVYRTITTGTLEEKIAQLLERKRGISDAVIGKAVSAKMEWTREEMLDLLRPLEDMDPDRH